MIVDKLLGFTLYMYWRVQVEGLLFESRRQFGTSELKGTWIRDGVRQPNSCSLVFSSGWDSFSGYWCFGEKKQEWAGRKVSSPEVPCLPRLYTSVYLFLAQDPGAHPLDGVWRTETVDIRFRCVRQVRGYHVDGAVLPCPSGAPVAAPPILLGTSTGRLGSVQGVFYQEREVASEVGKDPQWSHWRCTRLADTG